VDVAGDDLDDLARRAAAGDDAARDALLAAIRPDVLRRCGRFLPNRADAEEACQDVLLAVANGIGGFEGRSSFSTWLHRITSNRAQTTYRSLRRRAEALGALAPVGADPSTTSVIAGTRIDLLDALEALGPELAEPVALRDLLEVDYREIAALLGIPEGTVKSRIHEGRRRLRQRLR